MSDKVIHSLETIFDDETGELIHNAPISTVRNISFTLFGYKILIKIIKKL